LRLHAAAIEPLGTECVHVDSIAATEIYSNLLRAILALTLGVTLDPTGRAEPVMQHMLVELVVALLALALGELDLLLGANTQTAPSREQIEQLQVMAWAGSASTV
jgi:hypothetical protein